MKCEHKELIHDYLDLDGYIRKIKRRKRNTIIEFNAQSFTGKAVEDPTGLRYIAFKVDERVTNHIDLINNYNRNIEMCRRKQQYLNQFLSTLDHHTVMSLYRRYKNVAYFEDVQVMGHDEIVLDELLEIEEAIRFEFRNKRADELLNDTLEVEQASLTDDTVEDSFEAMKKLLGV